MKYLVVILLLVVYVHTSKATDTDPRIDIDSAQEKLKCAFAVTFKAASRIPCKGSSLLNCLCQSIDVLKNTVEAGVRKCGIDRSLLDIVIKGLHFVCSTRQRYDN